jgi:exopolyphosphatase
MLVDTANFKASAGKATPTDHEALRLIKDHLLIFLSAMQLDTKSLFEDLKRKKQDVSRLTSYQLLIRDFKRYEVLGVKYGLSTVPLSLENWSGKLGWDDIAQATQQLMEERSLDYVGILTSIVGEKVEGRQILVAFKDERLVGLKMAVEREAKETLDLRSWPDADVPALAGFQVFLWDQGIMGSRKQAAPAFDRAMRSLEALQ